MPIGLIPWTRRRPQALLLRQHPLIHNGHRLALTSYCNQQRRSSPPVLLIHGLTYSSHEFDVDYKDYSCARSLTRAGFSVWRLDLSGYGESDAGPDGFAINTDTAAAEIATAVAYIRKTTAAAQVHLLGWSWGTITAARMVTQHRNWIGRLVLYAPIVQGFDLPSPSSAWHQNSWAHAAADFPLHDREIDRLKVEFPVAAIFLSNCWRYDGERSPNGGRRDLMVGRATPLIHFAQLDLPTLVIGGTADPYLNWETIQAGFQQLPQATASKLVKLRGGGHLLMLERQHYRHFQREVIAFLRRN